MRYRIDLCYNGSAFCGWQIQPDAPSVQGSLETALGTLLKAKTAVTGAGRTDAGVHASAYVAHFDCASVLDCKNLKYKLNAILPDGIAVSSVTRATDGFHARFDARRREYTYYLHREKDPFLDATSYLYGYPELDFEAMNKAAEALTGRHNFSCFEKSGGDNKTSTCLVYEAFWSTYSPVNQAQGGEGKYWFFRIAADRFLRNMVRAIVGTLLEVGRGKRSVEEFKSLILPAGEDGKAEKSLRSCAGESVPGYALFLSGVEY